MIATENFNMLYKLDSIDAYERKLVKQIEVASLEVQDNHNQAYIKLISVDNKKSPITAKNVNQSQLRVERIYLKPLVDERFMKVM